MAGVADIVVVLRRAGEVEAVVPAHRVLDDLDRRLEVRVEQLREESRRRICRAHENAGRGGIDIALHATVEPGRRERLEVRALAALDVENLDVLALAHLVGVGRSGADAELVTGIGKGLGYAALGRGRRIEARHEHLQPCRRILLRCIHGPARGGDDDDAVLVGRQPAFLARGCLHPETPYRAFEPRRHADAPEGADEGFAGLAALGQQGPQSRRGARIRSAEDPGRLETGGVHGNDLAHLAAFRVDDRQAIAGEDPHDHRTAAGHHVAFDAGGQPANAGKE